MKLSIVIPAYNEEHRIGKTLPLIIEYAKNFGKKYSLETEIIVINDGAKDKTLDVLNRFKEDIHIVSYYPNMGKGYALREGMKVAKGDLIYLADADLSTPIENIENFYNAIEGWDCIIGSRALAQEKIKRTLPRKILAQGSNLLIRSVLGLKFKDTQCGFKMFNNKAKECLLECKNNRFGYDFEFLYIMNQKGLKVKDVPVEWKEITGDSTVKPFSYVKTLQELLNVRRMHK